MATKTTTAPNGADQTFPTSIYVDGSEKTQLIEALNQHLADTADLYSQNKQAHWNVKGKDFFQLHQLFDTLAEEIQPFIDEIAERVTALGGYATGTVRMAAESSRLPEFPVDCLEGGDVLRVMVERYGAFCAATHEGIESTDELGDPTTADLLTDISRVADKHLYFLEAHLQR
jgi:starvation-inducible DNA-binding protein